MVTLHFDCNFHVVFPQSVCFIFVCVTFWLGRWNSCQSIDWISTNFHKLLIYYVCIHRNTFFINYVNLHLKTMERKSSVELSPYTINMSWKWHIGSFLVNSTFSFCVVLMFNDSIYIIKCDNIKIQIVFGRSFRNLVERKFANIGGAIASCYNNPRQKQECNSPILSNSFDCFRLHKLYAINLLFLLFTGF